MRVRNFTLALLLCALIPNLVFAKPKTRCTRGTLVTKKDTASGSLVTARYRLGEQQALCLPASSNWLYFHRVIEDSRCPIGANCIWQGRARIRVIAKRAGRLVGGVLGLLGLEATTENTPSRPTTGQDVVPSTVKLGRTKVTFTELTPIPNVSEAEEQSPVATFEVEIPCAGRCNSIISKLDPEPSPPEPTPATPTPDPTPPPVNDNNNECKPNPEQVCIALYAPVCGLNSTGQRETYSNSCVMAAQCGKFVSEGECPKEP